MAIEYIADILCYCGLSSIVDYSSGDNLEYVLDGEEKPSKDELFQIAHDMAQSIADLHFNAEGRATIVHMDIKPDQWILLEGRFKLNDFNSARFLSWNPREQQFCNIASGYSGNPYQAPEQLNEDAPRTEKIDVYGLGSMMGLLLTMEWPFPELSGDSAEEALANGTIWTITDPKILNSTHPFDIHVRKAMEMCLVYEPEKRPRAQDVADMLRKALEEYKAEQPQQQHY